jgi:glutamine synthetase
MDFEALPMSCTQSAENLERDRQLYEKDGVFPAKLLNKTIETLRGFKDMNLTKEVSSRSREVQRLLTAYLHHG